MVRHGCIAPEVGPDRRVLAAAAHQDVVQIGGAVHLNIYVGAADAGVDVGPHRLLGDEGVALGKPGIDGRGALGHQVDIVQGVGVQVLKGDGVAHVGLHRRGGTVAHLAAELSAGDGVHAGRGQHHAVMVAGSGVLRGLLAALLGYGVVAGGQGQALHDLLDLAGIVSFQAPARHGGHHRRGVAGDAPQIGELQLARGNEIIRSLFEVVQRHRHVEHLAGTVQHHVDLRADVARSDGGIVFHQLGRLGIAELLADNPGVGVADGGYAVVLLRGLPVGLVAAVGQVGQAVAGAGHHHDLHRHPPVPGGGIVAVPERGHADGVLHVRVQRLDRVERHPAGGVALELPAQAVVGKAVRCAGDVDAAGALIGPSAAIRPDPHGPGVEVIAHGGIRPDEHIPAHGLLHHAGGAGGVEHKVEVDAAVLGGAGRCRADEVAAAVHRSLDGGGGAHIHIHLGKHGFKVLQVHLSRVVADQALGDKAGAVDIYQLEVILGAALQAQRALTGDGPVRILDGGEAHHHAAVFVLHLGIAVINDIVGVLHVKLLVGAHLIRAAHRGDTHQLDVVIEHGGELLPRLIQVHLQRGVVFIAVVIGLLGRFHLGVQVQEHIFALVRAALDALGEHQPDIGVRHGFIFLVAVILGEFLLHRGVFRAGGLDLAEFHFVGVVARLVLGHVVQGVAVGAGDLGIQGGDGEFDLGLRLAGVAGALLQGPCARLHLDLGQLVGQALLVLAPGDERLVALLHDGPVEGGRLVHRIGHAGGGGLEVALPQVGDDGRGVVVGGEGELLHCGALNAVVIHQPQVQVVLGHLIQLDGVHLDGMGDVLHYAQGAIAQIAADSPGLELVGRGGGAAGGQQGVVQPAALIGHHGDLGQVHAGLGHHRVAGGERGHRIVRGGKGSNLHGAAVVPPIHQDGADIVGAVGGQPVHLGGVLGVGGSGLHGARLEDLTAVDGGLQQVLLAHRAVGHRRDRPMYSTRLIGAEHQGGGVGGHVLHRRIARHQLGVGGGLVGGHAVHLGAVDVAGDAGTDGDLVGQHLHLAARCGNVEVFDIPAAGHLGGHVQVELAHPGAIVDNHLGLGGILIHRDFFGVAPGDLKGGLGGKVYNLLQVAGHLEQGALLAVLMDESQAMAVSGGVLHVGVGAHTGDGYVGVALGADADELVGDAVHHHLVGGHVAQNHAALAGAALTRAADHDLAQHLHVFQQYVAQVDAAGEVEVARDHAVAQGDAGGIDGHIAVDAAQGVLALLADGGADGAHQHGGHLAPGDVPLGLEAAVLIAADNPLGNGGPDEAPAPVAQGAAVGETQGLARGAPEHQVAGEQHRGLLPGERGVGGGRGGARPLEIADIVANINIVIEPVPGAHVGKRHPVQLVIAVGPVHHGHELGAGDAAAQAQRAAGVAPHNAPVHQLLGIGHGPVVRRLGGQRHPGQQAQDKGQNQYAGQMPAQAVPDRLIAAVLSHECDLSFPARPRQTPVRSMCRLPPLRPPARRSWAAPAAVG